MQHKKTAETIGDFIENKTTDKITGKFKNSRTPAERK